MQFKQRFILSAIFLAAMMCAAQEVSQSSLDRFGQSLGEPTIDEPFRYRLERVEKYNRDPCDLERVKEEITIKELAYDTATGKWASQEEKKDIYVAGFTVVERQIRASNNEYVRTLVQTTYPEEWPGKVKESVGYVSKAPTEAPRPELLLSSITQAPVRRALLKAIESGRAVIEEEVNLEGVECLRISVDNEAESDVVLFWVEKSSGNVIQKERLNKEGLVTERYRANNYRQLGGLWVPETATTQHYKYDQGEPTVSYQESTNILTFERGVDLAPEIFEITFPVGTLVQDSVLMKHIVVGEIDEQVSQPEPRIVGKAQ